MSQPTTRLLIPIAVAVMIWALAIVWVRHETVKTSFTVAQKRQELARLREENIRLQSRLEQLQSPARLEKLAKEVYRLGPATKDQIINLPDLANTSKTP